MNRLFARLQTWAAERPTDPALVHCGAVVQTWQSLQAAMAGVQAALKNAGVGAEDRVLLHLPAGPDWVVACLGVWAAGAAIVPVDPSLPMQRRVEIAQRSGAQLSIGPTLVPSHSQIEPTGDVVRTPVLWRPEQLAWLLFSSGSTGSAKGVLVTCGNYAQVLEAQASALQLTTSSRCFWALSPGFDASLSDVGVALWAGAALHTDVAGLLADVVAFRDVLHAQRITYVDLPPRYLDLLSPDELPHLDVVLCGGEPLAPAGAKTWSTARRLVGVYGPTEATICTSLWHVTPTDVGRAHLGVPIAGARYREVVGELWIASPGLARGYLNPDKTAERFIMVDGVRWFKTGDAVRRADDGSWLFVGRVDRQAKVDGRLVCPEEIEAVLLSVPGVFGARVDVQYRGNVAVLHARVEGDALSEDTLRRALNERLPKWMVPRRLDVGRVLRGPSGKAVRQDVLATTLSDVLGCVLREDQSLSEAGLDSIRALDAAARLMTEGIVLAPEQLRAADSLQRLRGAVQPTARPIADLVKTGSELAIRTRVQPSSSSAVLLTGATGGLGVRVLPRLLEQGHDVVALVRASGADAARARLVGALQTAGVDASLALAVQVIAGFLPDLPALPDVAAVVHLAAQVDLSLDAESLWRTNVLGTQALIGLGRPMLYASTLSVFVDSDAPRGRFGPATPLPDAQLIGGYAQTKLVAEVAVRQSTIPSCVVRYGLLTPDPDHGRVGEQDWLGLCIRGLFTVGCIPQAALTRQLEVDITPQGDAAGCTVTLLGQLLDDCAPSVAHVSGQEPKTLLDLVTALRAVAPVEVVAEDVFVERVRRALVRSDSAAQAAALLGLVRGLSPDALAVHRSLDLFQATGCRFDPMPGVTAVGPGYLQRVVRLALGREA